MLKGATFTRVVQFSDWTRFALEAGLRIASEVSSVSGMRLWGAAPDVVMSRTGCPPIDDQ
jgi:hypothetical protein